jgi:hypothetical protein
VDLLAPGVQIAFGFFGLALLLAFAGELLGTAISLVKRILG